MAGFSLSVRTCSRFSAVRPQAGWSEWLEPVVGDTLRQGLQVDHAHYGTCAFGSRHIVTNLVVHIRVGISLGGSLS
jgi:hypothetical protein